MIVRALPPLLILILTLLCDAALLGGAPPDAGQLAGWLLLFVLPGAALVLALPPDLRPRDLLERGILAFGFSLALAMLCFWLAALVPGLGVITRWLVVESLLILAFSFAALWQRARAPDASRLTLEASRLALLAVVLLVAALFRFVSLGYGEFYDDELDVVQSARSQLLGQTSVIFEHRKGPTEIWLTAVAAGTSTRLDEWTLRLPFALASLGALAATFLVGEEFFGRQHGTLAALILGAEGIFLAFSRMVQYQGVVLLTVLLVAWCALRFAQVRERRSEWFYLASGALFWSFGTLTHWDGALSGALLAYAVAHKWRASLLKPRLLFIAALAAAIPALFYLQLFFNPQVANLKTYAGERIGFGIFNSVPAFMLHASFYDAFVFVVALLALVGVYLVRWLPRGRWLALGALIAPFVWADFLQIGALNFSLLVFLAVLIALLRSPTPILPHKLISLWLFAYFVVYAFVVKSAGLHFYTLMPALALVATLALADGWRWLRARPLPLRALAVAAAAFVLASAYTFDAIAYLREQPEYALRYPQSAMPLFPTLYHERPTDFFFGFPYRYGWSVIGALYRQGVLRGKFESNETYLVTDWYARDLEVARADEPRYYLRVDDSPRAGAPSPDLDEKFHHWGVVRVHGETKIQIYESNRYPSADLRVLDAEQFSTSDANLLARSLVYRQARGDDRAFRDLGRFLEKTLRADDALVLDTPLQDAIVPYYYRGDARITAAEGIGTAPLVYASLFAAGEGERWLALNAFPLESRWFGSVRLATYAPRLPVENGETLSRAADLLFGDAIRLDRYAIAAKDGIVRVQLQWTCLAPVHTRYKVFVHVLSGGKVIAQRDADPMADLVPTDTWRVGQSIGDLHGIRLPAGLPAQSLSLAIGLYDPQTDQRLPVRDAQGALLPDGRLLLESVVAP